MHVVKLLLKMDQSKWPCSIDRKEICDLLALEDDRYVLDIVLYRYVGMDWRGFVNINFTKDKPRDDKDNIIFIFIFS